MSGRVDLLIAGGVDPLMDIGLIPNSSEYIASPLSSYVLACKSYNLHTQINLQNCLLPKFFLDAATLTTIFLSQRYLEITEFKLSSTEKEE